MSDGRILVVAVVVAVWMPFQSLKGGEHTLEHPGTLMNHYHYPICVLDFIWTGPFRDFQLSIRVSGGHGGEHDVNPARGVTRIIGNIGSLWARPFI